MSLENITDLDFELALVAAVEEKGRDYVYPDSEKGEADLCRYVSDGKPSCLIGNALHRLGVPLKTLAGLEGRGANTVLRSLRATRLSLATVNAADMAQGEQDDGKTWGEALAEFYTWRDKVVEIAEAQSVV